MSWTIVAKSHLTSAPCVSDTPSAHQCSLLGCQILLAVISSAQIAERGRPEKYIYGELWRKPGGRIPILRRLHRFWYIFIHVDTFSYILGHFDTFSYIFIHFQTLGKTTIKFRGPKRCSYMCIFRHVETFWDIFRHFDTFSDIFRPWVKLPKNLGVQKTILFWDKFLPRRVWTLIP